MRYGLSDTTHVASSCACARLAGSPLSKTRSSQRTDDGTTGCAKCARRYRIRKCAISWRTYACRSCSDANSRVCAFTVPCQTNRGTVYSVQCVCVRACVRVCKHVRHTLRARVQTFLKWKTERAARENLEQTLAAALLPLMHQMICARSVCAHVRAARRVPD